MKTLTLTLTLAVTLIASVSASALELDTKQQVQLKAATDGARCGILAQHMGETEEVLQVYANLAKPFSNYSSLIYESGYVAGVVDAQVYCKDQRHDEVARNLYKKFGCKANVSI